MRNQVPLFAAAAALLFAACDKKSAETQEAPRPLAKDPAPAATKPGDLSTSLADVRAAFNARKGEARFLTLLSPT